MYKVLLISSDGVFLKQAQRFIGNINSNINIETLEDLSMLNNTLRSIQDLDVIVCDHNPPGIDAISVFKNINRMNCLKPFIIMTKKADGDVAIKAFELRIDYYVSRENVMNFYMDLSTKIVLCAEKVRIESYRQLSESRMNSLLSMATMHDREFSDVLNYALNASVKLTNSTIGYIAMYEEDTKKLKMAAWSLGGPEQCKMENRQITYDFDSTGVWGEPIRQKRAIIINNYVSNSEYHKNGLPEGHVHLNRLLMIPIYHNGRIMATAGVGNKSSEYTEDDTVQFTLLMDGLMSIYHERMLEEENVKSEHKLRSVMINAPIGILIVNENLSIIESNEYARSFLASHSLCLSKEPLRTASNDISRLISIDVNEICKTGESGEFKHSIESNGNDLVLKVNISPVSDKNTAISGFIIIIDDITEATRAEKALHQTVERMNTLDTLINEDVKTTIKRLKSDVETMPDSEARDRILSKIDNLDDILGFVKEYHDVGIVDQEWHDLEKIIDNAVRSNRLPPGFAKYNIKGVKILADPAFYNVFSNMIMYSLTQGIHVTECRLKCEIIDGDLIISYSDDGSGIAYEHKSSFVSGTSMEYGRGIYLAFNVLRASGFTSKETGVPGRGMNIEITVPSSNYSMSF